MRNGLRAQTVSQIDPGFVALHHPAQIMNTQDKRRHRTQTVTLGSAVLLTRPTCGCLGSTNELGCLPSRGRTRGSTPNNDKPTAIFCSCSRVSWAICELSSTQGAKGTSTSCSFRITCMPDPWILFSCSSLTKTVLVGTLDGHSLFANHGDPSFCPANLQPRTHVST